MTLAVANGVIQNMCSAASRSIRDTGGLALICPSPSLGSWRRCVRSLSKACRLICELHGSTRTSQLSTGPELAQLSTSLGCQSLTRSLSLPSTKLSSKWCTVTRLHKRVQATLACLRMRTGPR